MSQAFLDSNVVLYLLSGDEAKAERAEALLKTNPIISVQVLNEVTSVCRRKHKLEWIEIQTLLDAIKSYCSVVALTEESHAKAIQLAQVHQLSFYDAHILSSAVLSNANILMTEDLAAGSVLNGVLIQNPFVA